MRYRHTPDMGEISGFGEDYEKTCQDMLEMGMEWLNAHPDCDLKLSSFKGVTGIVNADNDDAQQLIDAVVAGSYDPETKRNEATGAMVHTVMERLFFIRINGWDKYCEELRKGHADNGSP